MRTFNSLEPLVCGTFQPARSTTASILAGTSKRNALAPWLVAVALVLTAHQAWACNINVTGVNFGSYDVFSSNALNSTGNIDLNCPTGVSYSIALTAGSGSHAQRVMNSGGHTLNYNLYTAADRTVVWGDATNGTATVGGSGTGVSVNYGIYGRIPALQNVSAKSYSDTITVTLIF